MIIKQSVINTFDRIRAQYLALDNTAKTETATNWLSGATCPVTPLVLYCIQWVYSETMKQEAGKSKTRLDDFDRVRYFILETDPNAYNVCID
jgi:hypothetical protein